MISKYQSAFAKAINAQGGEAAAALGGFFYFFCILCGYAVLRPVRDSMGLAGGVENLPWLFTGTFVASFVTASLFGWLTSRVQRHVFLTGSYLFFVANILVFALLFKLRPDDPWVARVFFIWVSVFNLFVISVFWSFMADLFSKEQAGRLFGFIAAGGSAGALAGPAITTVFVGSFGQVFLLVLSAVFICLALLIIHFLLRWENRSAVSSHVGHKKEEEQPLKGGTFSGIKLFLQSPYLLGIGSFIILYTAISTFLYLQQAELVANAFSDSNERIRVFAAVDVIVNLLSILTQLFLTGRLVKRFGLTIILAAIPVMMVIAFVTLSFWPVLAAVLIIQVVRRAGNYAITRPGREMLFTILDKESKYKAKNFIDTVIYRGGDVVNAWIYTGLGVIGLGLSGIALVGAGIAAVWAMIAILLGKHFTITRAPMSYSEPAVDEKES